MSGECAARIRAARAYAGLKQTELADRIGVDVQTIKRREGGRTRAKPGELHAIASACGVPVGFLQNGFGEAPRDEIIERLERVEQMVASNQELLVVNGAPDLEPVREYVGRIVTLLESGEDAPGSLVRGARPGRGPRREAPRRLPPR